MFNKIKTFFIHPSRFDVINFQKTIELENKLKALDEYIVALARCSLVRPGKLVQEAQNIKANAEYLVSMVKAKDDNKK